MDIIQTVRLTKEYKKGKIIVPALKDINLSVKKGEYISIVGKSGSGKSTLLNLIGGLDQATSGKLIVNNKPLHEMGRNELAKHRKHTVGIIFQSFNLINTRTILENITLALAFGGTKRSERNKKAEEMLSRVGLSGRINHKPSEISGGETQRVAVARALANNPEIILADEPTGNLDSSTSEEIMSILKKLNKEYGKTVLMITHDEEIARNVSDRIIRLKDGMVTGL